MAVWGPDSDIAAFIADDAAKAAARDDVDYSNCEAHAWALDYAAANPDARLEDLFRAAAELDDIDAPLWAAVVIEQHHDELWPEAFDILVDVMQVAPSVKTWLAYEKVAQWLTAEQTAAVMQAIISIGENNNPTLVRWAQQVLGGA
jgi:hypothetical protein